MIVPAKTIPLHITRILTLKPGSTYDTPSGLGGSFEVRFDGYQGDRAEFTIISSEPPPEGWRGEKRSFLITDLHNKLHATVPDSVWYDGGVKELAALQSLGYPEDSDEMATLRRRCPKLFAAA